MPHSEEPCEIIPTLSRINKIPLIEKSSTDVGTIIVLLSVLFACGCVNTMTVQALVFVLYQLWLLSISFHFICFFLRILRNS